MNVNCKSSQILTAIIGSQPLFSNAMGMSSFSHGALLRRLSSQFKLKSHYCHFEAPSFSFHIRWDRSLFAAWDIFSVLQHKRNVFWDQIVLLSRKIPTLLQKTHIIAWCLPHRSLICRKLTVIAKYSQYSKIKAKTITFSNIALSMFLFKENPCVAQFMDNRPFPLHSCRAKSPDNTISCRNCGSLSVVKSS